MNIDSNGWLTSEYSTAKLARVKDGILWLWDKRRKVEVAFTAIDWMLLVKSSVGYEKQ